MLPRALTPHRVVIAPVDGYDADGPVHGDPAEHRAYVEDKRRIIYDGTQQVTSTTRVWLELDAPVQVDALCTVWAGTPQERRTPVVAVNRYDFPGTPSHLEVDLA